MPIRPENLARYPADWPAISARVRLRADNRCEFCGVPNHQLGAWIDGKWHVAWPKGSERGDQPRQGGEFRCVRGDSMEVRKVVRVVLTVAHLDHQPENCDDDNLKALCQRCHNVYDGPHRRAGRAARLRAQAADADLFQT